VLENPEVQTSGKKVISDFISERNPRICVSIHSGALKLKSRDEGIVQLESIG
jgi:hypothetical protein